MIMQTPPPKSRSHRPTWCLSLSSTDFPRGPLRLYSYLCAFPTGVCWLYNYRLARQFDISNDTARRWLRWLDRHALIRRYRHKQTQRRIAAVRFDSLEAWLVATTAQQLVPKNPNPQRPSRDKAAWSDLSPAQFEARRQRLLGQLLPFSGCATLHTHKRPKGISLISP